MKQNVLISRRLLGQLCRYHLAGDRDPALVHEIENELRWKMDTVIAHDNYVPRRDAGVDKGGQGKGVNNMSEVSDTIKLQFRSECEDLLAKAWDEYHTHGITDETAEDICDAADLADVYDMPSLRAALTEQLAYMEGRVPARDIDDDDPAETHSR